MMSYAAPHARSGREVKSIIEAERRGSPFLLWRDSTGVQRIVDVSGHERLTLGRGSANDVVLADDSEVSRLHAELLSIGSEWAISDDGLSRNGTFVNGARISSRRRLSDGDTIRLGRTVLEYRMPGERFTAVTSSAAYVPTVASLTDTQRAVLLALCRPYKTADGYATPATNKQIAGEVFLSVEAVKSHLRALFQRFEVGDLPQNQKRTRLVERAFQCGLVSEHDL